MEAECRYVGFFGTRCLMKNNTKYFLCSTQKKKLKKKKKEKNQQTTQQQQKKNLSGNKGTKALSSQHLSSLLYRLWKSVFWKQIPNAFLVLSCELQKISEVGDGSYKSSLKEHGKFSQLCCRDSHWMQYVNAVYLVSWQKEDTFETKKKNLKFKSNFK